MRNTVALTPDQKPGVEAGTGAPAPVLHDFRTFRQSDCHGGGNKKGSSTCSSLVYARLSFACLVYISNIVCMDIHTRSILSMYIYIYIHIYIYI